MKKIVPQSKPASGTINKNVSSPALSRTRLYTVAYVSS